MESKTQLNIGTVLNRKIVEEENLYYPKKQLNVGTVSTEKSLRRQTQYPKHTYTIHTLSWLDRDTSIKRGGV